MKIPDAVIAAVVAVVAVSPVGAAPIIGSPVGGLPIVAAQKAEKRPTLCATKPSLRGEVYFLERIALPPNARLHVAVSQNIAGVMVPIATTLVAARNGTTPFRVELPSSGFSRLSVQAWIVSPDRVLIKSLAPLAFSSFSTPVRLRVGTFSSRPVANMTALHGTVTKLDRRALLPDARVVVTLSDVSRVDAPAVQIASQTVELRGRQLPVAWRFSFRADRMKPTNKYALRAQVLEGGKLSYSTDTFLGVTAQNLNDKRELRVRSVR